MKAVTQKQLVNQLGDPIDQIRSLFGPLDESRNQSMLHGYKPPKKLPKSSKPKVRAEDMILCSAALCLDPLGLDVPWIQCDNCDLWYHNLCEHLDPNTDYSQGDYICRECSPVHKPNPSNVQVEDIMSEPLFGADLSENLISTQVSGLNSTSIGTPSTSKPSDLVQINAESVDPVIEIPPSRSTRVRKPNSKFKDYDCT